MGWFGVLHRDVLSYRTKAVTSSLAMATLFLKLLRETFGVGDMPLYSRNRSTFRLYSHALCLPFGIKYGFNTRLESVVRL